MGVDHFNRSCKGAANKRAVGSVCGEIRDGNVHITNCYAVPFEEARNDPRVWYVDHLYHEDMFYMMKKVNAKERFMGWYSTGPKIKPADLEIHQLYRQYTPEPVFLIIDVEPKETELPIEAYYCVDEKTSDPKLKELSEYLGAVLTEDKKKSIPANHQIISNIQDIFNYLPDTGSEDMVKAFSVGTNDMTLALYLGNILRTTIALHDLINTKIPPNPRTRTKKLTKQRT